MGRATIATIAQTAGVSTATVDRVLNGRPGASAVNRQRVLHAAREVGYLAREGTIILPARPARLCFLIPRSGAFMQVISDAILGFAKELPLVEHCGVIPLDGVGPDAFERALDHLPVDTQGVGVITTDHPRARAALDRLSQGGVPVVTIASDVMSARKSSYVGIDNFAAGRTAAQLIAMAAGNSEGSVAVFTGSPEFHGHRERERGFQSYISERCPKLSVGSTIKTSERSTLSYQSMHDILRKVQNLRGVYCIGAGQRGVVDALVETSPTPRPFVVLHDLTPNSSRWLNEEAIDAVIDQNARMVGEQAVIRLLGAIASAKPIFPVKDIEIRVFFRENLPD
ncbi:MAG: LacI family transcriptional regulator [Paracoccaceae bacterium]|jgi:LacI family transcriptional regulator